MTEIAIPAKPRHATPLPSQVYFLHGGIEMLTSDLRKLDRPISTETVAEAQALIQRVKALEEALERRLREQVLEAEE